tara:strand:- start:229 stop:480 length:252 start_codon:yes stop_codon:yes gene_type:complete
MDKKLIETKISNLMQKKSNIKIKNIGKKDDLYKKEIIDSFDMLNIISQIEKDFEIEIKLEKVKTFKFSISYLTNIVNKQLKTR